MIELLTNFAATGCASNSLFGFPTWYKYLPAATDPTTHAIIQPCTPQITGIGDFWLIGAAIIEILLRIAAIAAIVYVVYGGFEYMTSQGEPDKTSKARGTIIAALAGLVIAVTATGVITFIAGRFH